ncbi:glycosyltransferase family 2 protein [Jiella sp. MQZ9-1]|uniref:Glycosyltransferase family 2 protein n=1 Tax=Jiella flava TaxID=2816857 RepID=A0A939FV27_9HYPH|nr:glycosyltransferase family A protein [Jiella flava]MBO0661389.1 glycosyltransferase family 2 protein [Jiella flava]MCD2470033.1 glycosyltransferase family 2 protein [Jiella flava]
MQKDAVDVRRMLSKFLTIKSRSSNAISTNILSEKMGARSELQSSDGVILFLKIHGPQSVLQDFDHYFSESTFSPTIINNSGFIVFDAEHRTISIQDAWYHHDRSLRVRIDRNKGQQSVSTWHFYQYDSASNETLHLLSRDIDRKEMGFVDIPLHNPYFPLLIVAKDPEGEIIDSGIIPFPSLCRNGLHYAELCAFAGDATFHASLRALSYQLTLALIGQHHGEHDPALGEIEVFTRWTGDEDAIFNPDLTAWLDWLCPTLKITYSPIFEAGRKLQPAPEATDERSLETLLLPPRTIPTLQALLATGSRHPSRGVDFLVAEQDTAFPMWRVALPAIAADLERLQPIGGQNHFPRLLSNPRQPETHEQPTPCAIKFVDRERLGEKINLLMPVSPDVSAILPGIDAGHSPKVTVLVLDSDAPAIGLNQTLGSLSRQTNADELQVLVELSDDHAADCSAVEHVLGPLFPNRSIVFESQPGRDAASAYEKALAVASGDYLVVMSRNIVLHDHRTLEALVALAAQPDVGSAGCMLVREGTLKNELEVVFHSAGFFPLSPPNGEDETTAPLHCLDVFEKTTYPVGQNSPFLQAIAMPLAKSCENLRNGLTGPDGYSRQASARGLAHLCTTGISAGLFIEPTLPAPSWIDNAVCRSEQFPLAAGLQKLHG